MPRAHPHRLRGRDQDHASHQLRCQRLSFERRTPDEILAAIKQAHEGGTPMSPAVASRVFALLARLTKPAVPVELSTREKELLQLLVEGLTNKEISTRLQISPHTTDTHLRHLFTKLGVKNLAAAVARALKDGLA